MKRSWKGQWAVRVRDVAKSLFFLSLATLVGMMFKRMDMSDTNVVMAYIICVLLTAVAASKKIYSLTSSLLSVLAFNYFFTEPYFTLKAYSDDYPITFLTMFLCAFITSTLAARMKQQMKAASDAAFRTQVLLETNQMVQQKSEPKEVASVVAGQLVKLLKRDVIFYLADGKVLSEAYIFSAAGSAVGSEAGVSATSGVPERSLERRMLDKEKYTSEPERKVAVWAFEHNQNAGATMAEQPQAHCLYLPVHAGEKVYGVVAVPVPNPEEPLGHFEYNITLSILGECALALEKEEALRAREESALLAKNEQLRANLLRSISHDLRTPLTTISGNAGILLANANDMDSSSRQQLYANIYDDSLWLINLVENLLSVTRIEDGTMQLHLSAELMDEVITEALEHVNRRKAGHKITVQPSEEFWLVKIDARLIMQVIVNIVDNAIKYTPEGSEIHIATSCKDGMIVVDIGDNGGGIPDEAKERIFERFFVVEKEHGVVDSRRSLGLGLSLCKAIITAHGGTIEVLDNHPRGALFRFTLPKEEVTLRE